MLEFFPLGFDSKVAATTLARRFGYCEHVWIQLLIKYFRKGNLITTIQSCNVIVNNICVFKQVFPFRAMNKYNLIQFITGFVFFGGFFLLLVTVFQSNKMCFVIHVRFSQSIQTGCLTLLFFACIKFTVLRNRNDNFSAGLKVTCHFSDTFSTWYHL